MSVGTISLILSIVAILISIRSFVYTKRQTEIMESQQATKAREDAASAEWLEKFDEAVALVMKIFPYWLATTNAYGAVFPDRDLRKRIETYLIEVEAQRCKARLPSAELLRMPSVQKTITEVFQCTERFKKTNSDGATQIGL